ncbi:MAG: hypothetical protein JM58_15675 [Peptococcaceae bacterium BICA1-8]|nr:MAG: hypothetical protein JM58_15675 [Peptococcaceae bacterium BICA1-8]
MERIICDILVVGGGGGGLRAALAVKEKNPQLKVVLATKGALGKSGVTALACSDRMAFHATLAHTEPQEPHSWKYHAQDIYEIGGKVSDGILAEILAQNGEKAFNYLDEIGVPFVRKEGLVDQFITDGSDYPRACYTGPKTAVHIEEALVREILKNNIQIVEYCMLVKILLERNQVKGTIAVDTRQDNLDKGLMVFETKAIILATGGGGKAFKYNVFPEGGTGDAYALAYSVGAQLVNMEFIQIGIASTKTKLNCSGSAMRAIPRFVNDKGEEFLYSYFPEGTSLKEMYNYVFQKGASWPVSYEHKTHIIDIAVYKEINKGNKVFLDYSTNPTGFSFADLDPIWQERYNTEISNNLGKEARKASPLNRLKEINSPSIRWLKGHSLDVEVGEMVQIATCAQHFQGGVKIDEKGETNIKGLYAVGECAGGQHGANRPGGNALLDCQVFGQITGEDAANKCPVIQQAAISGNEIEEFKTEVKKMIGTVGIEALKARSELQEVMNQFASIVRTEKGLLEAAKRIKVLRDKQIKLDSHGIDFALETQNLIIISEIIVKSALMRDESRGPHLRFSEYTDNVPIRRKDPDWQKYIVIKKVNNEPELFVHNPLGFSFK